MIPLSINLPAINYIVSLCVLGVFIAIFRNFASAKKNQHIAKERKSYVATLSMILFFVAIYLILKLQIGTVLLTNAPTSLKYSLLIIGTILMILGAATNIIARFSLSHNWGNQIIIYKDHTLVRSGFYKIVRHPLYASLILMFFASAIIYCNWIVAILNALVFIPAMYYRAKLEEKALCEKFKDYKTYQKEVGMLFPKFI